MYGYIIKIALPDLGHCYIETGLAFVFMYVRLPFNKRYLQGHDTYIGTHTIPLPVSPAWGNQEDTP